MAGLKPTFKSKIGDFILFIIVIIFIIFLLQWLVGCRSAYAIDGEVFLGQYLNYNNYRAYPDGGQAFTKFGLEVGHRWDFFRVYYRMETITDGYSDHSTYHPSSIKYLPGIELFAFDDSLVINLEHLCWHPIDQGGTVEEYNYIGISYRFGKK